MLYVKEKVNDNMTIETKLQDDNVFYRCPLCGAEVSVDISALPSEGEIDLFSSIFYCPECSRKMRRDDHE